ncbi:MAG: amidoligase family protein [Pseudomonadota bacterium]|nr:amidoligase family protein [Pseudomonadota bacterium]
MPKTVQELFFPSDFRVAKQSFRREVNPKKSSKWIVRSEHLIGIEVEVEGLNSAPRGHCDVASSQTFIQELLPDGTVPADFEELRYWRMVGDGSLRNRGHEFITKPFTASYSGVVLGELFACLDRFGFSCTPRTGVHVHLNALDMTLQQVQRFVAAYTIVEPLLYKYVGRNRANNIFCVPLIDTNLLENIPGRVKDGEWYKYTGLNLLPLREHGTIEFRQMHGTAKIDKLIGWINMICSIKDFVMSRHNFPDIYYSSKGSVNAYQIVRDILGDSSELLKPDWFPLVYASLVESKRVFSTHGLKGLSGGTFKESAFYNFKEIL